MTQSKCPVCGCKKFYVKNPDDEYDIYEFKCKEGEICFEEDLDVMTVCAPSASYGETRKSMR